MWEMIEQMASNRLWIYTALAGSVFGAGFLFWFKDTRMATWAVQKFDATLEYLAVRLVCYYIHSQLWLQCLQALTKRLRFWAQWHQHTLYQLRRL